MPWHQGLAPCWWLPWRDPGRASPLRAPDNCQSGAAKLHNEELSAACRLSGSRPDNFRYAKCRPLVESPPPALAVGLRRLALRCSFPARPPATRPPPPGAPSLQSVGAYLGASRRRLRFSVGHWRDTAAEKTASIHNHPLKWKPMATRTPSALACCWLFSVVGLGETQNPPPQGVGVRVPLPAPPDLMRVPGISWWLEGDLRLLMAAILLQLGRI